MTDDWEFPEFELLERLKRIKEQNSFELRCPFFKQRQVWFERCDFNSLNRKYLSFFIYSDNKPTLYLMKSLPGEMQYTHKEYFNPTDEQITESIRWFFE